MLESISKSTTKTAKKLLLLTIIGANLFIFALIIERLNFHSLFEDAADMEVQAQKLADSIQLADVMLTTSARLAAATGDTRWIERYTSAIPLMDEALENAAVLASVKESRNFQSVAKLANDNLVTIETRVIELVKKGNLIDASSLLNSEEYNRDKQVLGKATDNFIGSILQATHDNLDSLRNWTMIGYGLLIIVGAVGSYLLWKVLTFTLYKSEQSIEESENKIRDLAMKDSLTGLSNRYHFEEVSTTMIKNAERDESKLALLMLDLDRFKPVNDTYGHEMGDTVLRQVSKRLKQVLRTNDVSARFGGDEFVVMLNVDSDKCDVVEIAQRIISEVRKPITSDGKTVQIDASIGAAFLPDDAANFSELMRKADIALYSAKNAGRGMAKLFSGEMDDEVAHQQFVKENIRNSIKSGEFIPYFQPIFDIASNKIHSLELLARWQHPKHGLLTPDQFLGQVIEFDLINELTLSLLKYGCQRVAELPLSISISLNIAARQINDVWLVERILAILRETNFPADRLIIEITESALITDFDVARKILKSWQKRGIRVAIDDFGTGYSSLTYLSKLPFDELKIDRSFIEDINSSEDNKKIISTIITLSNSLGIKTVAEGVETIQQYESLTELGCDMVQGYLLSRPVAYDGLAKTLGKIPAEVGQSTGT